LPLPIWICVLVLVWVSPAALAKSALDSGPNDVTAISDTSPSAQSAETDARPIAATPPQESMPSAFAAASPIAGSEVPKSHKWDWKASTVQTLEFTLFDHLARLAMDPSLRSQLLHQPFVHDWFASYGGYDLKRWSDGDDFLVDDVGHPLQGAITSRLYLQNNPRSFVPISKNRNYWVPWGQSMIWAAIWQVEWKVGPLSETSIGNAGGWNYVPGAALRPPA
jgi:hypothetical protein